ncbi:MAG: S24 family peptidase, partial [Verrucomicrobiales bacterium]
RRPAQFGEIVAALVDETTVTLKRLLKVRGKSVLHAENRNYRDITPTTGLEIQGVLVGLIRNKAL